MRNALLKKAFIYFLMGTAFIYIAILSAGETVWNVTTLLLAAVAAMDYWVVLKLLNTHFRKKNKKE